MRRFIIFLTFAVTMITACRPEETQQVVYTPTAISLSAQLRDVTPTPTLAAGMAHDIPIPRVGWENKAGIKVISATYCCGPIPEFAQRNYIPDAQIWGDGYILWAENNVDGTRSVYEAQLSQEQVSALLQSAAGQGFFTWSELYTSPLQQSDLPNKCLTIAMTSMSQSVCEYGEGAPNAFHALYDSIASGAGADGKDYQPQTGYLLSYPAVVPDQGAYADIPPWDAAGMGFSLADATGGVWIRGPVLERTWALVNANPWGTMVAEDGALYFVSLQFPGMSMLEPPER